MAKKRRRAPAKPWEHPGETRENHLDGMFDSMRTAANKALNRSDISIGTEQDQDLVGLPLPAWCLMYLFQTSVLPLSRIIQITGEEGTCKSSLLFEFMRWHHIYGGGSVFIDNENKDSPELRKSVLEWRPRWLARHEIAKTYVLEEWMDTLTAFVEIATKQQEEEVGPGHTIPICFGLDSLMATAPAKVLEAIADEGHSKLGFPIAARLISEYMRSMPNRLQNFPFTIVGTNHLKPSTDYQGRPSKSSPGGKSVKFMETYEFEMSRAQKADIDKLDYGGIKLKLKTAKNAVGPSRRAIFAELLWRFTMIDGMMRQQTMWDWHTASIDMVANFEKMTGKKSLYDKLREITGIRIVNKGRREAYSEILNCGTKNDPVKFRELGRCLMTRPDVYEETFAWLGITKRTAFSPGTDYRVTLAAAAQEAEVATRYLYEDIEGMPMPDADVLDPLGETEAAVMAEGIQQSEEKPQDG